MKLTTSLFLICYAAIGSIALAQVPPSPSEPVTPSASVALSPAIIMVRAKPGQSTTQTLTIVNHTANMVNFAVDTEDVVILDGKRSYSAAGRIANGIAATSVVSPVSVVVNSGGEASVQVTFTLPPETAQRAVATFFRGIVVAKGGVHLTASLGTLITFDVSGDYNLNAGPVQTSSQTPAANMIFSEELRNIGSEPVMPKGVIAVLNAAGKRVARAPFISQRLLPGEHLVFAATNPARLAPGHYHTLASFEFEGRIVTSAGEFTVPE